MTVYELTFEKGDSVDAVSLVEMPAIEEEALFLKTETNKIKLSLDTEKREKIQLKLPCKILCNLIKKIILH
jgi:hypothetical protein